MSNYELRGRWYRDFREWDKAHNEYLKKQKLLENSTDTKKVSSKTSKERNLREVSFK